MCEDYKSRMEVMNEELGRKNNELQTKIEELDAVKKEYEKAIKEFKDNGESPVRRTSTSKKVLSILLNLFITLFIEIYLPE